MGFVEKRAPNLKYIFLDTPGQIEVFNWSASGSIITDSFASVFPTVYIYVVDTPRSTSAQTFMSNMLYATSLFYRTRLPLIVVFTKTDIIKHDFALQWMTDYDSFDEACRSNDSYMGNFTQSMSLMISEFYKHFKCVGVSSITGAGMDELFEALSEAALDYETGYKVEYEERKKEKEQNEQNRQQDQIDKFTLDMHKVVLDVSHQNKDIGQTIIPQKQIPPDVQQQMDEGEEQEEDNDFDMETEQMEYEAFLEHMRKEATKDDTKKKT